MKLHVTKSNLKHLVQSVFNNVTSNTETAAPRQLYFDASLETGFYEADAGKLSETLQHLFSYILKLDKGMEVRVTKTSETGESVFVRFDILVAPQQPVASKFSKAYRRLFRSSAEQAAASEDAVSLSRQLVALMQGTLELTGKENAVSGFFFTLTFQKVKEQVPLQLQSNNTNHLNIPENLNFKILIAEDNPINMMIAKKMLVQKQAKVHEATNGQEVIDKIRACDDEPYHVLLLDLHLPVMTGFEVMDWMKRNGISLPVIAFTANIVDKNDLRKLKQSGFTDVLHKPFQSEELYGKIFIHAKNETVA